MPRASLRPTLYLSHSRASADPRRTRAAVRVLERLLPGGRVVDAGSLYKSNEDWLSRYRREIAGCDALAFFTTGGTIGYGVYCEMVAAEDRGVPTLLLAGGALYNTWVLSILDHRYAWKRFARVRARGHPVDPAEALRRVPRALPTGPLGRVIENRVIEYLLVLSDGRLVVYRPEADFSGTDLHVTRLHGKAVLKLQVKGRTEPAGARFLRFGVRLETMPPEDPKLLVFCWYDLERADFRPWIWVVPSEEYRQGSRVDHGLIKADLSTLRTATDRWVDYRYNTKDIAWVVEELLKRA